MSGPQVAQAIKRLLGDSMTVTELERKAELTVGIVKKWADGAEPGVLKLKKVADILGVTLDDLLKTATQEKEDTSSNLESRLKKALEVQPLGCDIILTPEENIIFRRN